MKKLLLGALAAFGLTLSANAQAFSGYPCYVEYIHGRTTFGDLGYIYATFYSEPMCEGSFVNWGYMCSTGYSNSSCHWATGSWVGHIEQMIYYAELLTDAAMNGKKVNPSTGAGGKPNLMSWVALDMN